MEAKTMGRFIAALRKANGMTQRDLAEKLNVSDKSVSRWERDEGSPDLSLIPVIAEVFGISCDELLRGERRPEAQRQEQQPGQEEISPKGEKQRRRLLHAGIAKYRSKTLLAVGLALLGIIGAAVCNAGFLRAYLGFFVGAALYLAAGICQAVFLNNALLTVADVEEGEDTAAFRRSVTRLALLVFGLVVLLFAYTLPLITLPQDTYMGLSSGTWLAAGLGYCLIALLLGLAGWHLWQGWCLHREGSMTTAAGRNWRRRGLAAAVCAIVVFVTAVGGAALFDASRLAENYRENFADFESFRSFMETPDDGYYAQDGMAASAVETYVTNEDGQLVEAPEEDWFFEEEVRISDGSPEGKVIGTFLWKNSSVVNYGFEEEKDGSYRFHVVTDAGWRQGKRDSETAGVLCVLLCLAEVAAAVLLYRRCREKE